MAGMADLEKQAQADKEEKAPLLPKDGSPLLPKDGSPKKYERQTTFHGNTDNAVTALKHLGNFLALNEPANVMEYETHDLATWKTYSYFVGTVLQNRLLWLVFAKLVCLAIAIAIALVFFGADPERIKVLQLDVVANVLNVFVGLMLAFFMKGSVDRWLSTVGGFLKLFDAIRNLSMQMHALGAPEVLRRQLTRYGLLSCEFLVVELRTRQETTEEKEETLKTLFDVSSDLGLEPWEQTAIQTVFGTAHRCSSQMWVWIASLIGRMAQDGWIPPMASPTYGRIMNLAQGAQEGIREVRVSMEVQMPFIYTHTLALLVHSNNIISAIYFGLTLAGNVSTIIWLAGYHFWYVDVLSADRQDSTTNQCLARICRSFITHMVAPLMYQAFLQIGLTLAQPFDDNFAPGISAIPTRKLIDQVRKDIEMSEKMIKGIKGWDAPHFKEPVTGTPVCTPKAAARVPKFAAP